MQTVTAKWSTFLTLLLQSSDLYVTPRTEQNILGLGRLLHGLIISRPAFFWMCRLEWTKTATLCTKCSTEEHSKGLMLLLVRSHPGPCCTQRHSNCRDEWRKDFVPQLCLNTSTWMDAVPHQYLAVCSLCLLVARVLREAMDHPGSSWIDRCAPPDIDHDLVALPLLYLHGSTMIFWNVANIWWHFNHQTRPADCAESKSKLTKLIFGSRRYCRTSWLDSSWNCSAMLQLNLATLIHFDPFWSSFSAFGNFRRPWQPFSHSQTDPGPVGTAIGEEAAHPGAIQTRQTCATCILMYFNVFKNGMKIGKDW